MTTRAAAIILAAGTALVALLLLAGGWYYSGEIREGVLRAKPPSLPSYDVEVLAVGEDTVTLERGASAEELVTGDVWGVNGRDGYGRIREIEQVLEDRVVRRYVHATGSRPEAGDRVDIEAAAFPRDPRIAFGLDYAEVRYKSELGLTPAWLVPGSRPTWVIFVHGLNSSRREALRLVGPVSRSGFPALVISYRNDPRAPETESGLRDWGRTGWRDVEGAVRYALEHGASQVALVGYSMGGALVTSFLYESRLAGEVVGAVLDAPALDLGEVIELEARQRTVPVVDTPIPSPLSDFAKTLTSWRYGVDWDRVDYVERADELEVPALVLHGTADPTVPIRTSAAFAEAQPDLVTLLRFPDAGHLQAWNLDRARYERRVLGFLERRAPEASADGR